MSSTVLNDVEARLLVDAEVWELSVVPELEPSIEDDEPEEAECRDECEVAPAMGADTLLACAKDGRETAIVTLF